jgi:Glycosyltransferase sugar-binding region containing DXD motif
MFWEGPCPAYIQTCLETARRHHPDVRLLDRAAFGDLWLEDREISLDHLGLHHVADFARVYLLRHYGGLYIDADTIVMRSLAPLIEAAAVHGFIGYREPQGYISNNFMAARADDAVIADHYARIVARLRDPRPLDWLEIGSDMLDQAVQHHGADALMLPTRSIMPLAWHDSAQLAIARSDHDHAAHFYPHSWVWMLSNNTIKGHPETQHLFEMNHDLLLADSSFLGYLLRRATNSE